VRRDGAWVAVDDSPPILTISALRGIDAAATAADGSQRLLLDAALREAVWVTWDADSSAVHDNVNVFRPTTGDASTGLGRWVRQSPALGVRTSRFTADATGLNAAATAAAALGCALIIDSAVTIAADVTLNVPVVVDGGSITYGSQVLTFNDHVTSLDANRAWLTGTGAVSMREGWAEWFGAVADWDEATDTGTDNAAALQRWANACRVCWIGPGRFGVTSAAVEFSPTRSRSVQVYGAGSGTDRATRITCNGASAFVWFKGTQAVGNDERLATFEIGGLTVRRGTSGPDDVVRFGSASATRLDAVTKRRVFDLQVVGGVNLTNARQIKFDRCLFESFTDTRLLRIAVEAGGTFCGDLEFWSCIFRLPDATANTHLLVENSDTSTEGQTAAIAEINGVKFYSCTFYGGERVVVVRANTGTTAVTGNTTSGSATVTGLSSTTGMAAGRPFGGAGINPHTRILSVDSATQITLDDVATATATGAALAFASNVRMIADWVFDGGCQFDGFAGRIVDIIADNGAEIDGLTFSAPWFNAANSGEAIRIQELGTVKGRISNVIFGPEGYYTRLNGRIARVEGGQNIRFYGGVVVDCGGSFSLAGTTTSGSPTVTVASTETLSSGLAVSGTGIPSGATISAIASSTTFTLSANATATGAPSLNFVAPEAFFFNQSRGGGVSAMRGIQQDKANYPGYNTGVRIAGLLSRDYVATDNVLGVATAVDDQVDHSTQVVFGNIVQGGFDRDYGAMGVKPGGSLTTRKLRDAAWRGEANTFLASQTVSVGSSGGFLTQAYGATPLSALRRSAGSAASPATIAQFAALGEQRFEGWDGTGWRIGAMISSLCIAATPSDTDFESLLEFRAVAGGSGTASLVAQMGHSGITFYGLVKPATDNNRNLGEASFRWATVFAGTGTINTSDATEKTALRALTDAEKRAIRAIVSGVGVYRWLSSVEEKGDAAREHIGVTAQAVEAAFAAEGLDARRYGLFCVDPLFETVEVEPEQIDLVETTKTVIDPDTGETHEVVVVEEVVTRAVLERRPVIDPKTGKQKMRLGVRSDQLLWLAIAALANA
jgi:hypothetical protein